MLKTVFQLIIFILLTSCGTPSKINSIPLIYENEVFTFRYPGDWKTYIDHAHLSLSPKKHLRSNKNRYHNIFDIMDYSSPNVKHLTVEDLIVREIEAAKNDAEETLFEKEILQTTYGEVVVVRMDKKNPYRPLKQLIHYYNYNNTIYVLKYTVNTNDYENDMEDAMIIFNSFKFNEYGF